MRKIVLVLAAAGMVVFTACGAQEGTVYAKDHTEGHYVTDSVPQYITVCGYDSFAKSTTCKQQFIGFRDEQRWVSECYALYFKNDEGKKGDDCVPQSTYDSTDIGEFYAKG